MSKREKLDFIMNGLMGRYKDRVNDVNKILKACINKGLIEKGEDIENDHIAFRTMGVNHLGIKSFEKIFLHYGYTRKEHLFFEGKKLDAYWYSPPESRYPRIFVSELRVGDLSSKAQQIIAKYTDQVKADPVDFLDLDDPIAIDHFLHSPLWSLPSLEDYDILNEESEYAAWVIYNRYYLNHYTISVHNLPQGYNTIVDFNEFLESISIKLNRAGGLIKTSGDGLLLQSSSVAQLVDAEFAGGVKRKIPGSYVEFAERKVLPQFGHLDKEDIRRIHRRDGFETANADKIFESTYLDQVLN
ncbi:DUF1338 domain-containing protein [Xanthovirga aplysinae]|uniref:DUF1338 domain-containing protein n=1 Tax=Xanthovirga aplysinae TaxID=2529853 RepID=UPI0012BCC1B6|nr:DUF1338 domain-containing protein [Xanthovirga aplysinae]MTI31254.1 DUF1338 domain-containing protein [Xanthovirga aplysinae]